MRGVSVTREATQGKDMNAIRLLIVVLTLSTSVFSQGEAGDTTQPGKATGETCPPDDPAKDPCNQGGADGDTCSGHEGVDSWGAAPAEPITGREDFYMGAGRVTKEGEQEKDHPCGSAEEGPNTGGVPGQDSTAGSYLDVLRLLSNSALNAPDPNWTFNLGARAELKNLLSNGNIIQHQTTGSWILYGRSMSDHGGGGTSGIRRGLQFRWKQRFTPQGATAYDLFTNPYTKLTIRRFIPVGDDPYIELFYTDGRIVHMERHHWDSGGGKTYQEYRTKWERDPFDNQTDWIYNYDPVTGDGDHRLLEVQEPNGLRHVYTWFDAWAVEQVQSPWVVYPWITEAHPWLSATEQEDYTTLDITLMSGTQVLTQTSIVFSRQGDQSNTPFRGAVPVRFFKRNQPYLPTTTLGTLYDTGDLKSGEYYCHEYQYDGSGRLSDIVSGTSSSLTVGALSNVEILEMRSYDSSNRISTLTDRYGAVSNYSYSVIGLPWVEEERADGTKIKTTTDTNGRVLEKLYLATNSGTLPREGLPRQSGTDPISSAIVNRNNLQQYPAAGLKYTYQYNGCGCGAPSQITYPSGSIVKLSYDTASGRITGRESPDPSDPGGSGRVTERWEWSPLGGAGINSAFVLTKNSVDSGTLDTPGTVLRETTYTYFSLPRLNSFYGKKVFASQSQTSVDLADSTQETILTTDLYDSFGNLISSVDGDGVLTDYQYDTGGSNPFALKKKLVGPNTGTRIVNEFTRDAWGRVLAETVYDGAAAHEYTVTYDYYSLNPAVPADKFGDVKSITRERGGQTLTEEEYYYDRWSLRALERILNQRSDGTAPAAHGEGTSSARDYVSREWHYDEIGRPIETFVDRRPLNEGDQGTTWNATDARMLRTAFTYYSDGPLETITLPNGATRTVTWDGYGMVYRTELTTANPVLDRGYGSTVTQSNSTLEEVRNFYNSDLELVAVYNGGVLQADLLDGGREHEAIVLERDASGSVQAISYPDNPDNVILRALTGFGGASLGAFTEFELNELGQAEIITTYATDAKQTVVAKTEQDFDQLDRVHTATEHLIGNNASGTAVTTILYSGESKIAKYTDPAGRVQEFEYDSFARITKGYDDNSPRQVEAESTYVPGTNFLEKIERTLFTATDAAGAGQSIKYVSEFEFDALGRLTLLRDLGKDGAATAKDHSFTYYSLGSTESYTDPEGSLQKFLPDALGRMVEMVKVGQTNDLRTHTDYQDWTGLNDRSKVLRYDGRDLPTVTHYDYAGRPIIIQRPGSDLTFDPATGSVGGGGLPSNFFPGKNTVFLEYDAKSQLHDAMEGWGLETLRFQDGLGRLMGTYMVSTTTSESTTGLSGVEVYRRDPLGQLAKIEGWNAAPLVQTSTPPALQTSVTFDHDSIGRNHKEAFKYAGLAGTADVVSAWGSDPYFRSSLTYSNGLKLDFSADNVGRLGSVDWTLPGQTQTTLAEYGHSSDVVSYRELNYSGSQQGVTKVDFDLYGRLAKIEDSIGSSTLSKYEFTYDLADNLLEEKYDKRGGSGVGGGDRFVYDDFHRLTESWMGLNAAGMGGGPLNEGTSTYVKKLTYDLDDGSNRDGVTTRFGPGGSPSTQNYQVEADSNRYTQAGISQLDYDSRGNLICDGQYFYVYDYRNRLSEVYEIVEGGGGESSSMTSGGASGSLRMPVLSARAQFQMMGNTEDLVAARDQILKQTDGELAAIGKEREKQIAEGDLSAEVKLTGTAPRGVSGGTMAAMTGGGVQLQLVAVYLHDAMNRRLVRSTTAFGISYYTYDGAREVEELGIDFLSSPLTTQAMKQFVWGDRLDELLAYRRNVSPFTSGGVWQEYFAHQGRNDSVVRLVNSSGSEVEAVEYDPYGKASVYVGSSYSGGLSTVGNPFLWNGMRLDQETGLVYVRNRFYSPGLGRFLTLDPAGVWFDAGSLGNAYNYSRNRPLTLVDRDGKFPWASGLIGAVAGILWEVGSAIVQDRDTSFGEIAAAAGTGFVAGATFGLVSPAVGAVSNPIVGAAVGGAAATVAAAGVNGRVPTGVELAIGIVTGPIGNRVRVKVEVRTSPLRAGHPELRPPGSGNGPRSTSFEFFYCTRLSKIGRAGRGKGVREVDGNVDDARELFDILRGDNPAREIRPGEFTAPGRNGGNATFRPSSKSGPPTVDVHGIEPGVRKIKFVGR